MALAKKTDLSPNDDKHSGGFWRYLPNNFTERAKNVLDTHVPVYDPVVARNYHALDVAGKVATVTQYIVILVAIISIVTSRALAGAEVSFTKSKPTYAEYVDLAENVDVLNLVCTTTNSTLVYGAFSTLTYEQSPVCADIIEDLKLEKLPDGADGPGDGGYVKKSQMGNSSACKTSAQTSNTCHLVKDNCEQGKKQLEALVERILATSLALPTLATSDFLKKTMDVQTNLTFQASLDSSKEALLTVKKWAGENMPIVYSFMQMHMNAIQALRLHNDTTLSSAVTTECARASNSACTLNLIGDGSCDSACNIPECLYDGSDCVDFNQLDESGPNLKSEWNFNATTFTWELAESFAGYAPLSLGNIEMFNPDYSGTCGSYAYTCSGKPVFSLPTNAFVPFDADTCANPTSWAQKRTVNLTEAQIRDQTDWSNYTWYEDLFIQDNIPVPLDKPDGNPPYSTKKTFTCDRYYNVFTPSSFDTTPAETLRAWAQHYRSMSRQIVDKCNGSDPAFADCTNGLNVLSLATSSEQYFFLYIHMGAIIKTAIENSGSLLELGYDASLKRDASGQYAIFPTTNHTKYFEYAGVTSCSYTKKLRPEPAALATVILGVIGGVVSMSRYVGIAAYALGKRRIVNRDASADVSTA